VIYELAPIADTYLSDNHLTTNYGTADALWAGNFHVGKSNDDRFRALMRFDLAEVDPRAAIDAATLTLAAVDGGNFNQNYSLYRSADPWTELGATWSTYDGVNNWSTSAGGATGAAWQTVLAAVVDTGDPVTFDDLVDAVVDAIANRAGILSLVCAGLENSSTNWIGFGSREHSEVAWRPKLTIQATVPRAPYSFDALFRRRLELEAAL
jgi:hypothetical protein